MSDDDRNPLAWIARYLGALPPVQLVEAIPIDEGARWRVEEVPGERFAVLREGDEEAGPDALFDDRRMAYVAAAVFTAFGGPLGEPEVDDAHLATADEVREPAGWSEDTAARLLYGLTRNPAALELLLEAAEPEVLEQARSILIERMIEGGDDRLH